MSEKMQVQKTPAADSAQPLYAPIKRRSFFMYAGATAGASALLLAGCDDDDDNDNVNPNSGGVTDVGALGGGEVGVLNYAYALEQLEAAFYQQVLAGGYFTGLAAGSAERQILTDIALHEAIHRDFFKAALGTNAIKGLTPNFSAVNFGDKASVLGTAKTFEDLGVAAYNGAGRFINTPANLTLAGKIVSVEARHAALIRDLLAPNTFVGDDVVDFSLTTATARQEKSKTPAQVLATANTFLANDSKVSANSLI